MCENPLDKYYNKDYPIQYQKEPGLESAMNPTPDAGERDYQGTNQLKNKKALITGGDSGIGRATAIAFAREGADVAINYLPEEQSDAEDVQKYIEDAGQKSVLIPGDLKSEDFNKQLVETAYNQLGGLDVLALIAGKQQAEEDITNLSTTQIFETFETNVYSIFWTTKAALKYLKPGASIITTTSIQAYQPSPFLLDYATTKGAILTLTKALSGQLAKQGIRVNTVAPGPIWTPLQVTGAQPQKNIPHFGQKAPLKRAGQPVELAPVYVFLASDKASYVTGQSYGVTGGDFTN
ncbi:SDR family oxidoreductase [Lentilactobacillus hilgardii]|uniref:SDR family oxidoreductase n=1 Tax=Lentilactobacillus hilgardii TaxID=1588 RepID=UPI0021A68AEB|nr:SDR family oxidoreductase [Lentilactobacillus hilgardii]MCP9333950.1 SDR family oxidoreductase [Lentilactobacillus hilgardii]MCP9350534.1 SDR family oxidoreductase [Lentilactobacillus hilgardii]MCP9353430.1 SDR family oxidoreductase [Lentilactobacillus hilgardii]MCT3397103.1 SDR family oxidoreductase [Lentilactobacillus hilgardii]MCT3399063.1 SDR family oxidoreductase [Lentilactobacillus hilgardii]